MRIRVRACILLATKRPDGISAGNVLQGMVGERMEIDGQAIIKVDAGEDFYGGDRRGGDAASVSTEGKTRVFLIIKTRSFGFL